MPRQATTKNRSAGMSTITLDDDTIEKLRSQAGSVQIRGAAGNVVGVFRPNTLHVYDRSETPDFDWEEIKRQRSSSEKLTTEEVMKRLRSRT
jgi:hypothetical protein